MARGSDFRRAYQAAERRARAWDLTHPKAVVVEYRESERRVHVELSTGALFAFPVDIVQGLADAPDRAIANVEITPSGHGLHWPALDADLLLEGLLSGVLGTRSWMQAIGRQGGRATSERKAAAARINGARGGRPRNGSRKR